MTLTSPSPTDEQFIDEIITAFEQARATGEGVYTNTVGYGDQYPLPKETHPISVELNNRAGGIAHTVQEDEYGFDQTGFGDHRYGAKRFVDLLLSLDIEPREEFICVYRDLGRGCDSEYPPFWLYAWATDDLMIVTTSNPINGDPSSKQVAGRMGYAGYIGIGGTRSRVDGAVDQLRTHARRIKDENPDGLFY